MSVIETVRFRVRARGMSKALDLAKAQARADGFRVPLRGHRAGVVRGQSVLAREYSVTQALISLIVGGSYRA